MQKPAITAYLLSSLLAIGGLGISSHALADPPWHAHAHGKAHKHEHKAAHKDKHKYKHQHKRYKHKPSKHHQPYASIEQLNRTAILQLLLGQPIHQPYSSLPPGIQKQLARGKPLPPGHAKKLTPALYQQLPHYQGYEWQQVGNNVVLVAAATGLIYEIFQNVFN